MSPCWSPDGKYIMSASENNKLLIWNSITGEMITSSPLLSELFPNTLVAVDWHPSEHLIAVGCYSKYYNKIDGNYPVTLYVKELTEQQRVSRSFS